MRRRAGSVPWRSDGFPQRKTPRWRPRRSRNPVIERTHLIAEDRLAVKREFLDKEQTLFQCRMKGLAADAQPFVDFLAPRKTENIFPGGGFRTAATTRSC